MQLQVLDQRVRVDLRGYSVVGGVMDFSPDEEDGSESGKLSRGTVRKYGRFSPSIWARETITDEPSTGGDFTRRSLGLGLGGGRELLSTNYVELVQLGAAGRAYDFWARDTAVASLAESDEIVRRSFRRRPNRSCADSG